MLLLGSIVTLASYTGPPIYSYVQILTSFKLSLSDPFGDDDDPVVVPLGDYLLEASTPSATRRRRRLSARARARLFVRRSR